MKLNATGQTTRKTASNAARNGIHRARLSESSGPISAPVAETAPIMTGTTTGRKRIGSITSRDRVFTAIALKTVPTAAIAARSQQSDRNQSGYRQRKVEHDGEHRVDDRLDYHHEDEVAQELSEVDGVSADGGKHQSVHVAALFLHAERAVQSEHTAERDRHPQYSRRDHRDHPGRGVYREVEDHDHQQTEYEHGHEDVLGPPFQQHVLGQDGEHRSEVAPHRASPGVPRIHLARRPFIHIQTPTRGTRPGRWTGWQPGLPGRSPYPGCAWP